MVSSPLVASTAMAFSTLAGSISFATFGRRTNAFGELRTGNTDLEGTLNVRQGIQVLLSNERNGRTLTSGTCRTTDTVDVVLSIMGCIIVDDHRDVVDVNASGHDIRSNQQVHLMSTEQLHHFVAFRL